MKKFIGFTLVELLITVFLLALLLGLAGGFFQTLLETYRQKVAINSIEKALTLARSLANTRNSTIWLCAANATMTDCAPNGQDKYLANWIIKDVNTKEVIHKYAPQDFVFYKTNNPRQAFIIKAYDNNSSNASVLICTGFNKIKPKGLAIGVTANYRYITKGRSFNRLLKKCNQL